MISVGDLLQNRYTIVRPLGSGGFGAVFLATDNRLADREVALKYFATSHLSGPEVAEAAQLFQQEAHTLANVNHPNLTPVLDYFAVDHGWVLVMAYVPGDTLSALQKRLNGPFGQEQVLNWAIAICDVLEYLHAQNPPLVFRDLKPSNIMRTPDGRIMLIDFGIARTFKEGQHQDTVQLGTPGYAPPEQYGGQTEPRSDLYSLGATMYVLLTNERLTGGFKIPPVHTLAPWVAPELDQLIQQLTALRPQERPVSAQAVREQLERIKTGEAVAPLAVADTYTTQSYSEPYAAPPAGPDAPTQLNPHLPSRTPRQTAPVAPAAPAIAKPRPQRQVRNGGLALVLIICVLFAGIGGAVYAFRDGLFGSDDANSGAVGATSPSPVASNDQPTTILVTSRPGETGAFDLFEMQLEDGSVRKAVPGHSDNAIADRRADGKLVYTHGVSQADGSVVEQIFTINADGSAETQLTSGPVVNRAPRWSPDGTQIVFESNRNQSADNPRDIYIMNADGSNLRQITNQDGWQGGPAWSPDGTRLAFHTKTTDQFEIALLDLSSGQQSTLAALDEEAFWPDWSPDGTKVAFMTGAGNDTGIYVVDVANAELSELTDELGAGINRWPRWSPDGTQLAFESQRSDRWQVYVYTFDDGAVRKISDGQRNDRWPTW